MYVHVLKYRKQIILIEITATRDSKDFVVPVSSVVNEDIIGSCALKNFAGAFSAVPCGIASKNVSDGFGGDGIATVVDFNPGIDIGAIGFVEDLTRIGVPEFWDGIG